MREWGLTRTESEHGTIAIPEGEHRFPPTPTEDIDRAVEDLRAHAAAWVDTPVAMRIEMLEQAMRDTMDAAPGWALAAAVAKGIDRISPHLGEDWISGPAPTMRNLRLLRDTLRDIERTGRPQPSGIRTRPDGQVVVDVFPSDVFDNLGFPGFKGEVRIQRGVDRSDVEARMGRVYRPGAPRDPGVALVLGAGNVSSIPPMDTLYELFAENRVVLLKMNPVNEYVGPYLADGFRVFVDAGFLRIVYGGIAEGAYCAEHPGIDEIHITGSDKTHDAIVFGTGEEGARRKAADEPVNTKPITSELGNVSPVIVVPGPWSPATSPTTATTRVDAGQERWVQLHRGPGDHHARRVEPTRRPARRGAGLAAAPSRACPTTRAPRTAGAPSSTPIPRPRATAPAAPAASRGPSSPTSTPTDPEDIAFTTEAFCGVFSEVGLDAPRSIPEFLEQAVEFCNETLWGTLSASDHRPPRLAQGPGRRRGRRAAIDDLGTGRWCSTTGRRCRTAP
jgi:hypothetical protein